MLGTSSFQALLPSFSSFLLSGLLFPLHSPAIPVHSSSNHPCWSPVPSSRWNLPRPSLKIHSRCSCHSEFPPPPMPALPESVNLAKLMFLMCLSPLQSTGQVPAQGLLDGYWVPCYSSDYTQNILAHFQSNQLCTAFPLAVFMLSASSREHPHLSKALPCLQSRVQMSCCFPRDISLLTLWFLLGLP